MSEKIETYESVWHALAEGPAEAGIMELRSQLMLEIRRRVMAWDVTQTEAARRLGISQPRLNDLLQGRVQHFRLDMLTKLAGKAGLKVKLQVEETLVSSP